MSSHEIGDETELVPPAFLLSASSVGIPNPELRNLKPDSGITDASYNRSRALFQHFSISAVQRFSQIPRMPYKGITPKASGHIAPPLGKT